MTTAELCLNCGKDCGDHFSGRCFAGSADYYLDDQGNLPLNRKYCPPSKMTHTTLANAKLDDHIWLYLTKEGAVAANKTDQLVEGVVIAVGDKTGNCVQIGFPDPSKINEKCGLQKHDGGDDDWQGYTTYSKDAEKYECLNYGGIVPCLIPPKPAKEPAPEPTKEPVKETPMTKTLANTQLDDRVLLFIDENGRISPTITDKAIEAVVIGVGYASGGDKVQIGIACDSDPHADPTTKNMSLANPANREYWAFKKYSKDAGKYWFWTLDITYGCHMLPKSKPAEEKSMPTIIKLSETKAGDRVRVSINNKHAVGASNERATHTIEAIATGKHSTGATELLFKKADYCETCCKESLQVGEMFAILEGSYIEVELLSRSEEVKPIVKGGAKEAVKEEIKPEPAKEEPKVKTEEKKAEVVLPTTTLADARLGDEVRIFVKENGEYIPYVGTFISECINVDVRLVAWKKKEQATLTATTGWKGAGSFYSNVRSVLAQPFLYADAFSRSTPCEIVSRANTEPAKEVLAEASKQETTKSFMPLALGFGAVAAALLSAGMNAAKPVRVQENETVPFEEEETVEDKEAVNG